MTRTAIEKLNDAQIAYCETMSARINRVRKCESEYDKESFVLRKGKLRGYLECLKDMGIITESDTRVLYTYYKDDDRKRK